MLKFFWGSNTGKGSVNYAKDFYPSAKRRIMIKGGPGTGKSSFMNRVANIAKEPVFFYCASAPQSLDAVADYALGYFISDATSPHILEPNLPGVRDEIMDFGRFLKREKLIKNQVAIEKAFAITKQHFNLAYASLAKALIIRTELEKSTEPLAKKHYLKLWDELRELSGVRYKEDLGNKEKRFISAYTPQGLKRLEIKADKTYLISVSPSLTPTFLDPLAELFIGSGYDSWFFMDPLDGSSYEGLYIPEAKIYLQVKWPEIKKTTNELLENLAREEESGIAELNRAFLAHEELEKLYIEAMDFMALNEYLQNFIEDLLGAD